MILFFPLSPLIPRTQPHFLIRRHMTHHSPLRHRPDRTGEFAAAAAASGRIEARRPLAVVRSGPGPRSRSKAPP